MADPFEIRPAPPKPNLLDPDYRQKLGESSVHAAKLLTAVIILSKLIPNPYGRAFATVAASIDRDPRSRAIRLEPLFALNVLPAPFGFMDAEVYGLKRNFYLPAGSSKYIPPIVDKLGLGTREQRAEDISADAVYAREFVRLRTSEELTAFVNGTFGTLDDTNQLVAFSRIPRSTVLQAAQYELQRRANGPTGPAGAFLAIASETFAPRPTANTTGHAERVVSAVAFVIGYGGIHPSQIEPLKLAGIANAEAAQGALADWPVETADP